LRTVVSSSSSKKNSAGVVRVAGINLGEPLAFSLLNSNTS
jgi:hypothetical protein